MNLRAAGNVLRIGLIAGTLDISENLVFNAVRHITPKMVFQYIASGLTGSWAFHADAVSVALGVAIHYTIAVVWTLVYWVLSQRVAVLIRRPVLSGMLYGGAVYLVMNWLILPLTRVPRARGDVAGFADQRSFGAAVLHRSHHCGPGAERRSAAFRRRRCRFGPEAARTA